MKENWIELAETPFDESLIMQRDGGGGRVYTYVAAKDYIKKLNFICDYEWESHIKEVVVEGNQVCVIGSITLGNGITKSDAGGGSIGTGRDGVAFRGDFGNAIKSATSDMIKRCCRQFGIGLDLYETDDTEARVEIQTQSESATVYAPTPVKQSGFSADREGWNPSQKQVNFLAKLKDDVADIAPALHDEIKDYLDSGNFDKTGPTCSRLIDAAKDAIKEPEMAL